ncbi:MAG: hypothetical protein ICV64_11580 [Thermoleophilia bacterium]|nr:hypothetical protein [Thermoleophilia bacterium]
MSAPLRRLLRVVTASLALLLYAWVAAVRAAARVKARKRTRRAARRRG